MNPTFPCFVALDSDGCVLDTMAAKQHGFLQPMLADTFGLEGEARQIYFDCADYVNLYSQTRGINRFGAILRNFTEFNRHPRTLELGLPKLPTEALQAFVDSGLPPCSEGLETWLKDHPDADLEKLCDWSKRVNTEIVRSGKVFDAYEGARTALKLMQGRCETGIVSQSPEAVLREDWGRQGLLGYVSHVAGQEVGLKVAQLTALTDGRYPRSRVLMVGDAPGDLEAARTFGCRFFPILPGRENDSWARFAQDIFAQFEADAYTTADEAALIEAFAGVLPTVPPWSVR